ncbi:MAG: ATP-binding protein [Oscillospiraceae bacterium]|nr:ATP-binding protein [Oscillospiraceae bacterium]
MLYTEQHVRENIRTREGERVFYLGKGDRLTPGARDWLTRERVAILPGEAAKPQEYRLPNGAVLREKPEELTHLQGNVLVPKTHPRIAFRGAMDSLEAELLLCQLNCPNLANQLGEILDLARRLIRCEVLDEAVPVQKLCGLTEEEQRSRSHRPQDYFGIPHFMPSAADGAVVLALNKCRCAARQAELAAVRAFTDADGRIARGDILKALNRMSSMIYILMCMVKSGKL